MNANQMAAQVANKLRSVRRNVVVFSTADNTGIECFQRLTAEKRIARYPDRLIGVYGYQAHAEDIAGDIQAAGVRCD